MIKFMFFVLFGKAYFPIVCRTKGTYYQHIITLSLTVSRRFVLIRT